MMVMLAAARLSQVPPGVGTVVQLERRLDAASIDIDRPAEVHLDSDRLPSSDDTVGSQRRGHVRDRGIEECAILQDLQLRLASPTVPPDSSRAALPELPLSFQPRPEE